MNTSKAKDYPDDIERKLDIIWTFINQQNVKKAHAACQQFTNQYPNNSDGWFALSFLMFQIKQYDLALTSIERAINLEPTKPRWLCHQSHTLLMKGDKQKALLIIEGLITSDLFNAQIDSKFKATAGADLAAELALILTKLERHNDAGRFYQLAIDHTQTNNMMKGQLYFNLASVQRFIGDIDSASQSLNLAIANNPSDYEAYLLRSSLQKQTHDTNHLVQLKTVLAKGVKQPIGKVQLHFAIAKEHEDLQQYPESFTALTMGANIRRQHMRYDVHNDVSTIEKIITVFNADFFDERANKGLTPSGFASAEPIFILGLPRTGSTLIERILSSHSDVHSAGELNNFALTMTQLCRQNIDNSLLSTDKLVEQSARLNFHQLGQAYLNSTRPETGKTAHFIDKLPLNCLYTGLIHLALPNAKIINVNRHPLAACYAIYKQLFTQGYPFSYDLNEIAQYYIAQQKLMAHWRQVLPDVIYDIDYEHVVDDLESQAKGLVAFCQLPWQSQCLNFQHNKQASTTASASQVRQGIYQQSKDMWRNYQQQLAPLQQLLEQAGFDCS